MASISSGPLHQDVIHALQIAAADHDEIVAARARQYAKKRSALGYQALRHSLNERRFIAPLDAETTKASIHYMKEKFKRFCLDVGHGSWTHAIKPTTCDKGMVMSFLHWICETSAGQRKSKALKQKTINQYWRDFKLLYRRANEGNIMDPNDCAEIVKYIRGELTLVFGLDVLPKEKPVMGVDDLLLGLTHHWSRDQSVFPTEGDRLDLALLMLFQAYTACRPAELVDGRKSKGRGDPLLDEPEIPTPRGKSDTDLDDSDYDDISRCDDESTNDGEENLRNSPCTFGTIDGFKYDTEGVADIGNQAPTDGWSSNDPVANSRHSAGIHETHKQPRKHKTLCYEDTTLWIVKDPKNNGRDLLALEVYFRHHKGVDNKPKPTVFLFREHPLPILCPISHFLARAIRDDAIHVDGYKSAEPFFTTHLDKNAVKVHWRPEVLKTPIFRSSIRTNDGKWEKAPEKPMKYSAYAFYLDRIGTGVGSEEKWTSYCLRRGNANALLGRAPDAIVDQVMRHNPMTGCLANAYLNHRVGFNVQDAFLERDPSADGLTRAFTHMNIRCDSEVPKAIPHTELNNIFSTSGAADISKSAKQKLREIRQKYGTLKSAPPAIQHEYQQMRRRLKNAKKNFQNDLTKAYRDASRRRIHNEELERQLTGAVVAKSAKPAVKHNLPERNQLQTILCDFQMDLGMKETTSRKVQAINLMVKLASRRELRQPQLRPTPSQKREKSTPNGSVVIAASQSPAPVPVVLDSKQCIFCIGDESLPREDRERIYSRASHMMTHVETVHLRWIPVKGTYICHHPSCKPLNKALKDIDAFKSHVLRVHGVKLRG